jgi:Uma2 family endonuclease
MATTTHLSLEEFHRRYDGEKPNYEYWFGEAVQKPMATDLHGVIQFVVMMLLKGLGWYPRSEVTLKLVPDAEPVPDVIAWRHRVKREAYATTPVDLGIEILSPQDRLTKTIDKGKYYLKWGIPNVWIIDPETRTAWMMTPEHPEGVHIPSDGNLVAGDTVIGLAEIFAEVDAMYL